LNNFRQKEIFSFIKIILKGVDSLETQKKSIVAIDLKQNNMLPLPQFIQHDTNIIEFDVKENGDSADFSNIGRIVANYKRPDKKVITRMLEAKEGTVSYTIGLEEMAVAGIAELELQFFSQDNLQRISTKRFKVSISQEIGSSEVAPGDNKLTLLQELFVEVDNLIAGTEQASQYATDQGDYAKQQGKLAEEKAEQAATEASNLSDMKTAAVSATEAANTSASNADEKALFAQEQGGFAKQQAEAAQTRITELNGVNAVQFDTRMKSVEGKLSQANRDSQSLTHGVSVINSSMNATADLTIQGRTLISLGNSILEATKQYVLADRKYKVKFADATTYSGVAKFAGKAERPSIIRVANFEGKVAGSTVESPHKAYRRGIETSLPSPTVMSGVEFSTGEDSTGYGRLAKVDGSIVSQSGSAVGAMSMHMFSYNVIEEFERNVGKIPGSTTAQKVQWLKDNTKLVNCNWHGFGSSAGGNKASLRFYNFTNNTWEGIGVTNSAQVSKVSQFVQAVLANAIDSNGFIHFLAYADPSDGVTASTINTDYVELEIELKPTADFHHPLVPLYEVTQAQYDSILTTWNEAEVMNRFPRVQGVQHLQNPAVIAEGENLLPPFYEWTLHANATVKGPYELELNATAQYQTSSYRIKAIFGQNYTATLPVNPNTYLQLSARDANNNRIGAFYHTVATGIATISIPSGTDSLLIEVVNSTPTGKFFFSNPMLTLGAVAKPFTPRNPSYLFAQAKLGQIGDRNDTLFKENGEWKVRKEIEKDVVLDGSLGWSFGAKLSGYKRVHLDPFPSAVNQGILTKNNGSLLRMYPAGLWDDISGDYFQLPGTHLRLTISDADSGWGITYNPTTDDIKRYFNGWKYQDGTTWISVTGNGQTATAATALTTKPSDYVPYKLSYVLTTPQVNIVTDKVEGDIVLNGLTQVEVTSGVVVREKVTPYLSGDTYLLNFNQQPTSHFKNIPSKVVGIYKNGVLDKKWLVGYSTIYRNNVQVYINKADFDTTAEYTVTYLVLDREKFTANVTEVKATFANNIRSALDEVVAKQGDMAATISVNVMAIAEMYKRLKALGG
jgi:BppU N-terminal domain